MAPKRAKRKANAAVEVQVVATGAISETGATEAAAGLSVTKKVAVEKVFYTTDMRPAKLNEPAHRILSWNVASLRSTLKKDAEAINRLINMEDADVMCLQETKLKDSDVEACEKLLRPGLQDWHFYFNNSTAKKGYSGVAILSRTKPLSVTNGLGTEDHDQEGRLITAEYPSYYVVNVYVPNSGEGLKRLDYRVGSWDVAFADYLASLGEKKPVILTGDLNCAHQEIDIHDPKRNLRSAGFTKEERESFSLQLLQRGFKDVFRETYPDIVGYTYWNYRTGARARNSGWRLDYFLVSEAMAGKVHDVFHLPDVQGSDHCPIGLVLHAH
ncbi:DNA-(apurinic or apyrimidinic site) lyase [Coccomyxa sp. Obi]|nr:DNA-(apurinic or apyrimidinic site) lyase [Coccomyxa sp. Obi]